MLFNSYPFVFAFLPVTLLAFFCLGRISKEWAAAWLALASIVFYGYWSAMYVPLLLGSVACNYACGRLLQRWAETVLGRRLLFASVAANLLLLGFYKYAGFFLAALGDIAGSDLPVLRIGLPIGISFFTFTQIAFLVDAYRRRAKEYSFTHYLLFVTYFPHLIAGPILHHAEIMPQFESAGVYRASARSFAIGLTTFAIGLAKKVLIADSFAAISSPVFDAAGGGVTIRLAAAWCGVLAYSFQLYFDFSGYSDMAIGISKLFGIDLPINFNSPYKSKSIIHFWRRWHMTLSRFLRDYLYFPLGGNRQGEVRRYLNLMLTMLLGGLWHGANYTFIIWGALHGVYLVVNHLWRAGRGHLPRSPRPANLAGAFFTFLAVTVAWIFFRSADLKTAMNMLSGLVGLNGIAVHDPSGRGWSLLAHWMPRLIITAEGALQHLPTVDGMTLGGYFIGAGVIVWAMPNTQQITRRVDAVLEPRAAGLLYRRAIPVFSGLLLALALLYMQTVSPFLYFQF
jgi:alginate O-acetyltransferase complex protein AlgI